MNLSPPKLPAPFRRGARRGAAPAGATDLDAAAGAAAPARDPDPELRSGVEPPELGWRKSSDDLKHGLDVVELPTSLPVDVLDRLFNAPAK